MENRELYDGIKDLFHDALNETIININENNKKEMQRYTNTLEKEMIQQRKEINGLDEKLDKLIDVLNKLV